MPGFETGKISSQGGGGYDYGYGTVLSRSGNAGQLIHQSVCAISVFSNILRIL